MYKNIRIPIGKTGKSRLQRVKVLKSGKYKFVKNPSRSRSKQTKTKRSNPKRRKKTRMARRKKGRRRYSMTIPLAPVAGLAAGLSHAVGPLMAGNFEGALVQISRVYTGVDPKDGSFDFNRLKAGLLPLVAGMLVHKFVGGPPLNLNKTLARAKVPFIRI